MQDKIISKKLLSEVLDVNVTMVSILENNNLIFIIGSSNIFSKINIYELADKCELWAHNKKDIRISTYREHKNKPNSNIEWIVEEFGLNKYMNHTEFKKGIIRPYAIFDICEKLL